MPEYEYTIICAAKQEQKPIFRTADRHVRIEYENGETDYKNIILYEVDGLVGFFDTHPKNAGCAFGGGA